MWTLAISAGLNFLKGRQAAKQKNREADRQWQRDINQHIIEEMATHNKWRNASEDEAIIAQRKRIDAQDNINQVTAELDEIEASTVNQINQLNTEYISGGYSETIGRRGGIGTTRRDKLLKQTGDRLALATKLTGKRDRTALIINKQQRDKKQAFYDWDRKVNAARPGGRHLPPHPGYTKGPSLFDSLLGVGTGLVSNKMNRDNLARQNNEKPVFTDNWFG